MTTAPMSRAFPTALALGAVAAPLQARAPDFARDVQPVLARHCYPCHGPDGKERKADLRLDSFAAATAVRKRGVRPIAAGREQAARRSRTRSAARLDRGRRRLRAALGVRAAAEAAAAD